MSLGLFSSPAPQLVMLANVAAVTAEVGGASGCVILPEGGGVCSEGGGDKEMMELKTVGGDFSDDEDDNIIRYSYDDQSQREVCIVEYPESPGFTLTTVEEEEEEDTDTLKVAPPTHKLTPPTTPESPQSPEKKAKKKPFHCKPCNFQAKTESQFVEHLQTHAVSKMILVNKVEGRSHRGKEAEPVRKEAGDANQNAEGGEIKGLIRCERCGYNTNRYDHYISHLKHHSKDQDHRVFKCTLCPYTTVSQYHWRKHLRNHFPSKLHTCSQCSYFSDRKSNYIQHIRTHSGVRPFQCPYCDYSSSQKTHLTRHMRTHSGERPFKCESCNYLAANQHEVTRHTRQVHNGPKPLACPYCEYKTADRSNFKKHVELHLNPRQFNCPLCKYAASKKCNLQYHLKSRHAGCNVELDVSKVKLRAKKPDHEDKDDGSPDEESLEDLEEDLDEDFEDKEPGSPINLSIKNKKSQDEAKKLVVNGKDTVKKLKQKKIEDFVKAVERMTPKKRCKKTEKVHEKYEAKEEARAKTDIGKGVGKVDKGVPSKEAKKAKSSKRKVTEVLDLSLKEERPVKMRKVKETDEKIRKKKGKLNLKEKSLPNIWNREPSQEVQNEVGEATTINGKDAENHEGEQEKVPEVDTNNPKVGPEDLSEVPLSIVEGKVTKQSEQSKIAHQSSPEKEKPEKKEIVTKSASKLEKSPKKSLKRKGILVEKVANKLARSKKSEKTLDNDSAILAKVFPHGDTANNAEMLPNDDEASKVKVMPNVCKYNGTEVDKPSQVSMVAAKAKTPSKIKKDCLAKIQAEVAGDGKHAAKKVAKTDEAKKDKKLAKTDEAKNAKKLAKTEEAKKAKKLAKTVEAKKAKKAKKVAKPDKTKKSKKLAKTDKANKAKSVAKSELGIHSKTVTCEGNHANIGPFDDEAIASEIIPKGDSQNKTEMVANADKANVAKISPVSSKTSQEIMLPNEDDACLAKTVSNGDKTNSANIETIEHSVNHNRAVANSEKANRADGKPCESSPTKESPAPPADVFVKPSGRPPLFLQRQTSSTARPGDCEEDEGIHEGASDVSDSASECSDDSGLKMLSPTDEVPTPISMVSKELKAHLCIFCDRAFALKSDYQRHLNRHLVNVYYSDHKYE
ncbi:unnamed protein product [Knipowitschia caucasica]